MKPAGPRRQKTAPTRRRCSPQDRGHGERFRRRRPVTSTLVSYLPETVRIIIILRARRPPCGPAVFPAAFSPHELIINRPAPVSIACLRSLVPRRNILPEARFALSVFRKISFGFFSPPPKNPLFRQETKRFSLGAVLLGKSIFASTTYVLRTRLIRYGHERSTSTHLFVVFSCHHYTDESLSQRTR